MRSLSIITLIFLLAFFSVSPLAFAADAEPVIVPSGLNNDAGVIVPPPIGGPGSKNTTLINPLNSGNCTPNGNCLESFLLNILAFVIRIGTVIVILMLVLVGYKFVVAQGEPAKITEARSMLLWTVVGALILIGAQAIALAIEATVKALSVGG